MMHVYDALSNSVRKGDSLWVDFPDKDSIGRLLKSLPKLKAYKKKLIVYHWETYTCIRCPFINNEEYRKVSDEDVRLLLEAALWVKFNKIVKGLLDEGTIVFTVGYSKSEVNDVVSSGDFSSPDFIFGE